jgi:hypothetical protein
MWDYLDSGGRLMGYVARVDRTDGKAVLPISYCRGSDGNCAWRLKALPPPRPLFNLPGLADNPSAPVLLVEGEKVSCAARELIEDHVCVTWQGGAGGVGSADWSQLAGRLITIWPDNDDEGRRAGDEVARAVLAAGAAEVRMVALPPGLPNGWDLADEIPGGLDVAALIAGAVDVRQGQLDRLGLINAADLVAKEFKPPKWAVPDFVPEGLSILAGRPKVGKSWMALDFAIAAAAGTAALGSAPCEGGDVLLIALEDTERRLNGRIKAVLQGAPAPASLTIATQWRRADDEGLHDLRVWLATHRNARLVLIDTLQMIRGRPDRDFGVYANDYAAINGFKKLADEFGVPILLVHHLRKESASDPLDAVSGTAGLTGSADTILVLKREPNDPFGILYVRGRDVIESETAIQFDNATGKWARLGAAQDFRKSEERRTIIRALIDADEPLTPAEIAQAVSKKPGAIRVTLSRMRSAGEVTRRMDGRYATP